MLENASKHVKLIIEYIFTNKRCFNIVRTVKVIKIGTNEPYEAETLRIDYGK